MKTLFEAIGNADSRATGLVKHLRNFGIDSWDKITKSQLYDFRDYLLTQVCASSAKTYFARFKVILKRYEDDGLFPCKDYAEILKAKEEKPQKIYLDEFDIRTLEKVKPQTNIEKLVKTLFLVECYTGARSSDVQSFTAENMDGNMLHYVSKKTSTQAIVPLKPIVPKLIEFIQANPMELSAATYNRALRRLCKRAEINDKVKVFKAGKFITGEKWQFVSSHTGRISFATNMAEMQVNVLDIAQMLGHSDIAMTQRYIVKKNISLSSMALQYFSR